MPKMIEPYRALFDFVVRATRILSRSLLFCAVMTGGSYDTDHDNRSTNRSADRFRVQPIDLEDVQVYG